MQFWEEAFYTELQRKIVELHVKEKQDSNNKPTDNGGCENGAAHLTKTATGDATSDDELTTQNSVNSNSVNNVGSNNLNNSTNNHHKKSSEVGSHNNHDTLLPATGTTGNGGSGSGGGGGSGTGSNRNSCLVAPTTPTTRMRISNAKSLSPVDAEVVEDENATTEMPDAMKLAADLVSLCSSYFLMRAQCTALVLSL